MTAFDRLLGIIQRITTKGLEQFGIFYSDYTAIVSSVDDPDKLHRIKVIVPEVYGKKEYPQWVLPRSVYAGKGYGIHILPQKGDIVSVSFRYGDPNKPRWDFGYYGIVGDKNSKKHYMDSEIDLMNPKKYWIITPGGQRILIDEVDESNPSISVKTKSGIELLIDTNGIFSIVETGKKIKLGSKDSDEASVLGSTHLKTIKSLYDIITQIVVLTPSGPGSLDPATIARFLENKAKLELSLSKKVFIE